ncbi:MAG: hypothetical protein JXA42_01475 [Anaerolineales bacterium]|nr:hypothetical protein [Anaerolineales bacterium]
MITRELIHKEIDNMSMEYINELYTLIKKFTHSKQVSNPTLMSKLKRIQINAPEDFSANHNEYMTGEK